MLHFKSTGKIDKDDDMSRVKLRSSSLTAPILEAVQEAQPFEEATFSNFQEKHPLTENSICNAYTIYDADGNLKPIKDTFGRDITTPDISNPTRPRDERPIDTIRGFEYSITKDPRWLRELETSKLGFKTRPGFSVINRDSQASINLPQLEKKVMESQKTANARPRSRFFSRLLGR
ncbi:YGR273C [Saccharomyces arboricola H-6]|uniref:YGR273C n=1 Tax=Saccharomyces arboricola (strain H-6 / AS 2.3317 / CBS 10644) TaxID=1160507 RepID=J8LNE3_SACAR|nr:YGR273C [Saccharomyces arboricola H-6]